MHRLFVALRPPPEVRVACLAAMDQGPAGWAWQDDDQLHCTVRYVGEVDRHTAEDVAGAIEAMTYSPVDLALAGVGQFDQGHQGALFARAAPAAALATLHSKVDRALVLIGLEPERRAYLPHITLARRRRDARAPADWLNRHAALSTRPYPGARLLLMESRLGKAGAHYETICAARER